MVDNAVDRFGELLVRGFRSNAIGLFDDLVRGGAVASCWKRHEETLAGLTEEQRLGMREILGHCVDCGLDQFLQAIRHSGVSLVVDGQEIGTSSVDLVGKMFYEAGWIERFSAQPAYGEGDDD